ncbi:MAG: ADP-ribosylglycohydrolase family protein [Chloroflexi bacterium]|nr:ADP-ribosylglycohydrolase family protein [Chloroflexota bacterium]
MSVSQSLEDTILFDKTYASMLAGAIGDAMGGPVEGWHYERIVEAYGVVNTLLPYDQSPDYHSHFAIAPGTVTDDTRLKHLLCQAIMARGDLPRRGDVVKTLADAYYAAQTDLERGFLEEYVLGGMHGEAKLIWGGQPTNGLIMANSPLGLICPADPERAFALSYDVDFISDGYAKYSAAMAAAAVAAAMRPQATVASVVEEVLAASQAHRAEGELARQWHWYEHVFQINESLVKRAVEIAAHHADVFSLRAEFYEHLQVSPLGSEAGQTLAVALGMLVAAGGDLRQTLIGLSACDAQAGLSACDAQAGCVNYGRDNDSYASVAGAIAGALQGTGAIPAGWRRTVEAANPEPDMRALVGAGASGSAAAAQNADIGHRSHCTDEWGSPEFGV